MCEFIRTSGLLIFILLTALPAQAQILAENVTVDSAIRIEYLFGRQTLGREFLDSSHGGGSLFGGGRNPDPIDRLHIDFDVSLPLIEGMVQITPLPSVSTRVIASLSVLEAGREFTLVSGPAPSTVGSSETESSAEMWNVIKPSFRSWEVAGLLHLSYEGGYRHSIVAGYRQESWTYRVDTNQGENSYLRDEFVSKSPFLGLQTAMFFPRWKAHLELLASPFMTKKVCHEARDGEYFQQLEGTWNKGGFIEIQTEGTVGVTPRVRMGIFFRCTYEELRGEVSAITNISGTHPYDFFTRKSMASFGLNLSYVF